MKAAFLGKIAQSGTDWVSTVERALERRRIEGTPGAATATLLARGVGWSVKDVICTHDRGDRPFEERHGAVSVALVLAGSFQYRHANSDELLVPGAWLLGNHGECFECSHHHAAGDRCVAFHFTPEFFERIATDAGHQRATFSASRIPPVRALARVSAEIFANLSRPNETAWEEVAVNIAAGALAMAGQTKRHTRPASSLNVSRVTQSIRQIEERPSAAYSLQSLAQAANVSAYHYLRVFERITGLTPHQFVLRTRLRHVASRIARETSRIAQIAYESGFGDLSNFNHSFRAEFGVSPRQWRYRHKYG